MQYNYETLKTVAKKVGVRVNDLLALSPKNDPFYAGTPGDIAKGEWFADVYRRAGYGIARAPHLRRIHYWVVSQKTPVLMTDGTPYENTERCWEYLQEASKKARYLELVPLNGIVDNKNPNPTIHAQYWDDTPAFQVETPKLNDPYISIYGLHDANVQPYHLEVWCEKSTMNDVLIPVCESFNANLVTFEGETSITAVCVNLLRRIEQAGKPTRIFYISDFDPAGNSMPVAMARKIEYALRLNALPYDVKVRPVAMTPDQVQTYQLPRIPIKETERRAGRFEAAFGSGAVELDALEALYPGELEQIVTSALEPYYSEQAQREVRRRAAELQQAVSHQVQQIVSKYTPEIEALRKMQEELAAISVDTEDYRVERYEPEIDEPDDWLFDSDRDYVDQLEHYKLHKSGMRTE